MHYPVMASASLGRLGQVCKRIALHCICHLALETANLSASDFTWLCVFMVTSLRIANFWYPHTDDSEHNMFCYFESRSLGRPTRDTIPTPYYGVIVAALIKYPRYLDMLVALFVFSNKGTPGTSTPHKDHSSRYGAVLASTSMGGLESWGPYTSLHDCMAAFASLNRPWPFSGLPSVSQVPFSQSSLPHLIYVGSHFLPSKKSNLFISS